MMKSKLDRAIPERNDEREDAFYAPYDSYDQTLLEQL